MNLEILQFILAKGSGDASLRRLLSFAHNKGYESTEYLCRNAMDISKELNININISKNIVASRDLALEMYEKLVDNNIEMIYLYHKSYPERLQATLEKGAPPVLFTQGNLELLKLKSVGFCGSRKASEKGLLITKRCSSKIVSNGYTVVSGYAHGVDMTAHKSALESGGTTIIVLVDGLLRTKEKNDLKHLLNKENYLFLSQFPPMITWMSRNAMKRNETIIGLSDAMILVESRLEGGTFSAGEETLKRKAHLFVIDYADPGPSAEANPYFIERGGISIRGNKEGQPYLSELFEIVDHHSSNSFSEKQKELFEL